MCCLFWLPCQLSSGENALSRISPSPRCYMTGYAWEYHRGILTGNEVLVLTRGSSDPHECIPWTFPVLFSTLNFSFDFELNTITSQWKKMELKLRAVLQEYKRNLLDKAGPGQIRLAQDVKRKLPCWQSQVGIFRKRLSPPLFLFFK